MIDDVPVNSEMLVITLSIFLRGAGKTRMEIQRRHHSDRMMED
jgi:hypothetical protein